MRNPEQVPWKQSVEDGRMAPRACIAAARDALNRAYSSEVAPWPQIAEAVDWQRRALEQMVADACRTPVSPQRWKVIGTSLPWRRALSDGNHSRPECLERPLEWCRGIGGHPGRCASCPTLREFGEEG